MRFRIPASEKCLLVLRHDFNSFRLGDDDVSHDLLAENVAEFPLQQLT